MPKPNERTKRAKVDNAPPPISRIARLKKDGVKNPAMPPNPAPHIVAHLIEIGLVEARGMGTGPVSWREINEWQRASGVNLTPWEARLIRRLSTEYVAEGGRAENENCPPPWRAPVTQQERDADEARLRMVLG